MIKDVPRVWSDTVEAHRRAVREAILDTTALLVSRHGLRSVAMGQIAEETGIARATLYRYFSGVEAILSAWHERQVAAHVDLLAQAAERPGSPLERLTAVLGTYASIVHEHHGTDLAAALHRGAHVARAQRRLTEFVRDLVAAGLEAGEIRRDVPPDELAHYCVHALAAAAGAPSRAAVRRLVEVTADGLRARD